MYGNMKVGLILLMFSLIVTGIKYDGLKVKYGPDPSDTFADKKYFFTIPRTISEAVDGGWNRTERPAGPLPQLQMYCHKGRFACPLFYNATGFVAGLQIAAPVEAIDPTLEPELDFVKWNAPKFGDEPAKDFWTATQFYVTEDSLAVGGPTIENGNTLQAGGVWVQGLNRTTWKILPTEAELNKTAFKKQNCVPNMGMHYYYNMTRQLTCNKPMLPWFALLTKGDLLGLGFQTFGQKPVASDPSKDFFEDIPRQPRTVPLRAIPHAPECFLDNSVTYGRLSIHIYYISKPWELRCEEKDSVDPALAATEPTTIETNRTETPKEETNHKETPNKETNPTKTPKINHKYTPKREKNGSQFVHQIGKHNLMHIILCLAWMYMYQ